MSDLPDKEPISIKVLGVDLAGRRIIKNWYGYGEPTADETGDYIPVEEYGEEGDIVATYKLRVTFEKENS